MLATTREKRAAETEERLASLRVADRCDLDEIAAHCTREFLDPDEARDRAFEPCSVGFTWKRGRETVPADRRDADTDVLTGEVSPEQAVGRNVWFRVRCTIPEEMAGHPVYLRFIARPRDGDADIGSPRVESLCFEDGVPIQAFDNGHESLLLTENADGGEEFEYLIEAGTTTLWGNLDVEEFVLQSAELFAERPEVADLHRHVSICRDLSAKYDAESPNHGRLQEALLQASHAFPFEAATEAKYAKGAQDALSHLTEVEGELTSDLTGHQLTAVGHAHIDLAWHWPWSETVRKGGRSFSNVLKLMDEYPDFTFMQSQPHLYEWVRNRYPDQFESIEERIDAGAWIPEGALWVESDINNAGAESLARQYLYGKRYFREHFDVDPEVTFIPDVFGYSAGLPTISQAADCPYFLTQKMSWNEINDFPHNTFRWEGLDGSEVLSHFPPVDTYNGMVDVDEATRSVYNDSQTDVADDRAYLIGYGDGGGGPTREMVERAAVIDDIEALPDIEWDSIAGLFDRLEGDWDDYPIWTGELYLEKHRGTLTTQGGTKRNNRLGENALTEAELWSSLALARADVEYPHERLQDAWKILLLNQFHDILPGSSVTDVYADSDRDYERVFETTSTVRDSALDSLIGEHSESERVCLTNPLSWIHAPTVSIPTNEVAVEGDELEAIADDSDPSDADRLVAQRTEATVGDAAVRGTELYLIDGPTVPALGAASVTLHETNDPVEVPFEASAHRLSNGLVTVEFNDDGTVSIFDGEAGRSVLDAPGNRFMLYRDHPRQFEAWDIEEDVYAVGEQLPSPESELVESGPVRATVRQTRTFGESELTQYISLYRDCRRVEFRTEVDWHEEEKLLKTHFPAAVSTTSATYDTHFGHLERDTHDNTTWDRARYEEPCGQWVDVSEPGYGMALLNDSKYGCNVDGTDVSLSLLRAPNHPDPEADRGTHEFTYTLLPHDDGPVAAGVQRAANQLNAPVRARPVEDAVSLSPISIDPESIIIESVKRAEDDSNELVLRLYESDGRHVSGTLGFDLPVTGARETNLIEDDKAHLSVDDGTLELDFDPFELRTVVIGLGA